MAWFRGTCRAINLVDEVAGRLTLSGHWSEISSSRFSDGYVFKSLGDSGNDNIIVQIKADSTSNRFTVGIASDYLPGTPGSAGVFTSPFSDFHYIAETGLGVNANVKWDLFYNKTRIILVTLFDQIEVGFGQNWKNTLLYAGLLDRVNPTDRGCNTLIYGLNKTSTTSYDAIAKFVTLKSSDARTLVTDHFTVAPILHKVKDSSAYCGEVNNFWTGKLGMYNIGTCDGATNSFRGWLDGIMCTSDTIASTFPAQDRDVVQYGGKNYMVVRPYNYNSYASPTYTLKGTKYILKDLLFIRMD